KRSLPGGDGYRTEQALQQQEDGPFFGKRVMVIHLPKGGPAMAGVKQFTHLHAMIRTWYNRSAD
ncbi:MAG: hypothetical protein J7M34_10685, partial [Anaerolineae bacterium]|nr:hypothetical protein [Anaerolineae bacterium]